MRPCVVGIQSRGEGVPFERHTTAVISLRTNAWCRLTVQDSIRTSAPDSFKRLLGSRPGTFAGDR